MGVLDDAIREHLELKRAHGADEAEVRRKEDEALGPARRTVADEDAVESAAAEPAEEALAEDAAMSGPPPAGDSFFEEADEPFPDATPPAELLAADLADADEPPLPEEPLAAGEPLPAEPPLEPEPPIAGDEAPLVEDAAVEEDFAYEDEPLEAERGFDPEPLPAEPESRFEPEPWAGEPERRFEPEPLPSEPEPRFEREAREPDAQLEPRSAPPAEGEDDVLEETPDFLQETPEHDRLWFEQKPPRDFDFDDDDR